MDVEINIVPRVIILSILGYFLIKLLLTLLHTGLSGQKKKNSYDLDQLIKSKQDFLRGSSGAETLSTSSSTQPSEQRNPRSAEIVYAQELKKTNAAELPEKFREITQILELFDALKWGQGPALHPLKEDFKSKTRFLLDDQQIVRTAKKIDAHGLFLMLNQSELPNIKIIHQIIEQSLLLQICAQELDQSNYKLIEQLAHSAQMTSDTFARAITCWAKRRLEMVGDYSQMGELDSPSILSAQEISLNPLFLFEEKRKNAVTIIKTIKEWQTIAQLYQALIPLAELPKNNLAACLAIFGLKELKLLDQDKLKRLYKLKAQGLHPDSLMNFQLSSAEQQIITHNFQIIQEAYHYLKDRLKA